MAVPVLSTKLYVPPTREKAVARPRLVDRLLVGTSRPSSFTILSGPAGFGKTTLLSGFAAQLQQPLAWVSLDEGDNDPIRFWTYLIMACRSIIGEMGESALELFRSAQPLSDDTVPTILINDLSSLDRSLVLVLDDYHEIQHASIHAGMLFLVEHLPSNLHLVLSTRTDPPWPLAGFRARNQLTEIRALDLRFSSEEASKFLNQTMGLDLSTEDVTALEERTEGWAAGLQLAALSLQGRGDIRAFVQDFKGSNLYIAEYLVEEVLQRQAEDVRSFLLQTSILTRMNAGLCEAVTGAADGQKILGALYRSNIFLVPLDSEGVWFRYHHLFADLLNARLRQSMSAEAVAALHLRAVGWYEREGFMLDAVSHALAAKDYERAASLIDRAGQTMIFTDQYTALRDWLDSLPAESFQAHPRLEIYRVLIDLSLGTIDMFEQTLQEKERLIKALPSSPDNDQLKLRAMVYLSSFYAHQNTSRAIEIAEGALAEAPAGSSKLHASLYSTLYRAHGMEGDIEKSAPAYRECLRLALSTREYGMISNTTMVRAFDLCQYGRLDEAARYCQVVIGAGAETKHKPYYSAGPAYIGLGGIHLERYDLATAEEYIQRGLELCRKGAMYGLYTGYNQRTRLLQAKGDLEGAWEQLQLLEQTLQRRDFTLTDRQVALRLAMSDITGAGALVAPLQEILGESHYAKKLPLIAAEAFKLGLVRIRIAQGEIELTKRLLDEIEATVEPGMRYGRLMEVYLLRALALQEENRGITEEALACLVRAIELGEPAGFFLLFLEAGPALTPLLQEVAQHSTASDVVKGYASRLLDAFGEPVEPATPHGKEAVGLVEPLTPREQEVLVLLAGGDTNQAIADRLFVTVRTVKKHNTNIYGKLNVSNRTQAVARARELGLLPAD